MKKVKFLFPWASSLYSLALAAYLYTGSDLSLVAESSMPIVWFESHYKLVALILLPVILLVDLITFHRRQHKYNRELDKARQHFNELLKTKNSLQSKAHKFSDHADKLKLFISDRLLEHIEYDEKFLHFKNIASEVRHNGVVCYDKVNSALKHAHANGDEITQQQCNNAQHAMHYLWDLLDLSTTDNIAPYIANKLYEAEEQHYQNLLQQQESPFTPAFSTRHAVHQALQGFANSDTNTLPELPAEPKTFRYHDDTFWVELKSAGDQLGNENYLVLLAENLINNALFYSVHEDNSNAHSRVEISTSLHHDHSRLCIYNHGPSIGEEHMDQIFQLGYSTKRVREHNGRGLGLYFVNEITKGYEGEIKVTNIINRPETYVLRIELSDGEKESHIIRTIFDDDGKLICDYAEQEHMSPTVSIELDSELASLEISVQASRKTYIVDDLKLTFTDPKQPARPQWCLDVEQQTGHSCIKFTPLDITGVEFEVKLPTIESRLNASYHDNNQYSHDEIDSLGEQFSEIEPFVK